MKKLLFLLPAATIGFAGLAVAHPTAVPYDTRGECEAAYAESSKDDRERLVELGNFPTQGAAQRTFNDIFACEYDAEDDKWYIVFTPPA